MIDASPAPPEDTPKRLTRREIASCLRSAIKRANPGTLAAIRRFNPDATPPAAFYRLVADALPKDTSLPEHDESAWASVTAAMASAKDFLSNVPLGEALARAGVAEMRVLRLLEANSAQLPDIVRNVVHQLVQKGQSFDPADIASLLLARDDEKNPRSAIARSYYRHADK